ncbi:MAG TPA: N-acetylmuramic acid 6-phosphate etherase [Cryomorphaceae bacterium]|nr:N-acetylmuramic acid 6-phosphate etherase [Cryomorphaceae bacterium]
MEKITEKESLYTDLDMKSIGEVLIDINREDAKVAAAVHDKLHQIEACLNEAIIRMQNGGRLFYIGAGTSGRLGVVDASECPPTFGVPHGLVVGIMAGGDGAMRKAVEFAEDDENRGWKDLKEHEIGGNDILVGIAASGTTPYVIGALKKARENKILTAAITCNPGAPVALASEFPIEINVGPEYVTGSTRMKSGTAQKLVLNMISTSLMIKMGRVKGNKMVDMQLSNNKLVDRGTKMVMEQTGADYEEANALLMKYGSVREAISHAQK